MFTHLFFAFVPNIALSELISLLVVLCYIRLTIWVSTVIHMAHISTCASFLSRLRCAFITRSTVVLFEIVIWLFHGCFRWFAIFVFLVLPFCQSKAVMILAFLTRTLIAKNDPTNWRLALIRDEEFTFFIMFFAVLDHVRLSATLQAIIVTPYNKPVIDGFSNFIKWFGRFLIFFKFKFELFFFLVIVSFILSTIHMHSIKTMFSWLSIHSQHHSFIHRILIIFGGWWSIWTKINLKFSLALQLNIAHWAFVILENTLISLRVFLASLIKALAHCTSETEYGFAIPALMWIYCNDSLMLCQTFVSFVATTFLWYFVFMAGNVFNFVCFVIAIWDFTKFFPFTRCLMSF